METAKEAIVIEVGMADMKIAENPAKLVTRGLGSCVGITLYDPLKKMGGMSHGMLPDIDKAKVKSNPLRFVNYSIRKMVSELEARGCRRERLEAKLFGGAHMFGFITADSALNVGEKNIESARRTLKEFGIKILAEEIGGTFGRTIQLDLETGKVMIKTISLGEKEV